MDDAVLRAMTDREVSDVHLRMGEPVWVRRCGQMRSTASGPLEASAIEATAASMLGPARRTRLGAGGDVDAAWQMPGGDRWRVHAFRTGGHLALALRRIPSLVPTLDALGLPPSLGTLVQRPSGLILVTGPTGSGKSSTLAALINGINGERQCHVLTIEDPIEYVHASRAALVTQRELDGDIDTMSAALRSAVRADPDVVLVGELRDEPTVDAALQLAETGHLTLATLHTRSAVATLHRVVDLAAPSRQGHVRSQLAMTLVGVVSQRLLPGASGDTRVVAVEVMLATPPIRHLLREGKVHQVPAAIQAAGRESGSWSLNQSLASLVASGRLDEREALLATDDEDDLRQWMARASRSPSGARG
jgi:twitching motility protein PilT